MVADHINSKNRTKNVKQNIIWTFLLKFGGIGISFILLPLTINYLDQVQYGIWVTLFTVMNWITFLDVGIGLGLRNKLAEAVASDNLSAAKQYISTAYIFIGCIGLLFIAILFAVSPFLNFNKIFNTLSVSNHEMYCAVQIAGFFIILNFSLSLINQIFYAYQKAKIAAGINLLANALMLVFVSALIQVSKANLIYFICCFGIANMIAYITLSIYFFHQHTDLLPKIKCFDCGFLKQITGVGIKFFVIQIVCILMFSSANILITQLLGPEHVRSYDVVFKIFGIVTMMHSLISTPLWSAYTEAHILNDKKWMKATLIKMILLMIPVILVCVCIVTNLEFIIKFWLKTDFPIPPYLPECMAFFIIISAWANTYAYFLNGISQVDTQMYCGIVGAIIVIPLAYYFVQTLLLGSTGVILAIGLVSCIPAIITPLQVLSYFKQK